MNGLIHKGFKRTVTIGVEPPGAVVENVQVQVNELLVLERTENPLVFYIGAPADATEGTYNVIVTADAQIGEGEVPLTLSFDVDVVPIQAQNLAVVFGDEIPL